MVQKDIPVKGAKALILGFTFKENCPDVRNTRVIDIYKDLIEFGLDVQIHDPWINQVETEIEYGITVNKQLNDNFADYKCIVLAVAHDEFKKLELSNDDAVIYDIKGVLPSTIGAVRL